MNIYVICLCGILAFTACSKDTESDPIMSCSKNEESFSSDDGVKLNLDTQNWYLEKNEIGGGSVNLFIKGSITGDRATVRTYGDGLIYDAEIVMDSNKEFSKDVSISFTATALPKGNIVSSTLIFIYNSTDTLKVDLESCTLRY
jgi:hypothetical protein